eukprot:CAMPEP_0198229482 /NCGR_PEP_ID=MMETSP1445-20131203/114147_1 /TAXON_ID=36898 /ORGANISM="Pyramimonas sp., Strain CCMP2087" /LENGTH=348 /DNA_ID=CAMNT_0043909945 /DNA_START=80 /DNA_END=1126 /DNA_ORIENTATION=+
MSESGGTDRKKLRQTLLAQKRRIIDERAKLTRQGPGNRLVETLDTMDRNFGEVEKARELAVDSDTMVTLSECGMEMARGALPGVSGCTPQQFLARLKTLYVAQLTAGAEVNDAFNWEALGTKAGKMFPTVPAFTCMLGPMSIQVKERKQPQRRQKQAPVGELVNPEQVTSTSDAKQQETDRNMNQMHKILKSVKRVSMARLMNNPRSFAQTVENLFTMSFLVRDGRAQLLHGKDGSIDVVSADGTPTDEEYASGVCDPGQIVFCYDVRDWKEMQEFVGTPAFLVPHREYTDEGMAADANQERGFPQGGEDSPGEQVRLLTKAAKGSSRNRPRENSSQEEERVPKIGRI